jgi:methionine synthase I (cobalamin-dependent)
MTPLLDVLRRGHVLLMDGAMGTQLQRAGLRGDENPTAWNHLQPRRVEVVHRAYVAAGAQVLLTNTFLINAGEGPASCPRAEECPHVLAAWRAALERTGDAPVYRLAAVGPVAGKSWAREFDDLRRFCVPARDAWGWAGVPRPPDGMLAETCSTPRVRLALRRLRDKGLPVLLSFSFRKDGSGKVLSASGHPPEWFAQRARAYGADALGVNCGRDIGMEDMAEIVRRYGDATDLPLFARPNAGTPRRRGRAWVYPHTPQDMAAGLVSLLDAGARMVGGCCGTTPAHVRAFRAIVDAWNARHGGTGASGRAVPRTWEFAGTARK